MESSAQEPHCCCCAGCDENPNGCPEGSVVVIDSGMDLQGRLYLVGADGSIRLFRSGAGEPDLSPRMRKQAEAAIKAHHAIRRKK